MRCLPSAASTPGRWEKGKFSDSQRQSVIRMIEKRGKSKEKINGWRPISLMNVDIKLLAKVLAERLKLVCKEIIGEEQLAYIEGNDVHEGHLLLFIKQGSRIGEWTA